MTRAIDLVRKKDIEKLLTKEPSREVPVNFFMDEELYSELKTRLSDHEKKVTVKEFFTAAANAYLSKK